MAGNRRAAPGALNVHIRLQPKQARVLSLLEATGNCPVWIGAGGAKGGGKSALIDMAALLLCLKYGDQFPGMVVTVVRRVSRDLYDNHIEPMRRNYPDLMRECWRGDDSQIVLPNGAIIAFRYAENEADVVRKFLGGYQSMFILVDEAQQFSEAELNNIKSAARWTRAVPTAAHPNPADVPKGLCKIALFFNPGGVGSAFIRRIFWLKQYIGREQARHYSFIHVFGFDNYEWFRGQVGITEEEFYGSMDGRVPPIAERCDRGDEDLNGAREDAATCCRYHTFVAFTSEGQKYFAFPISIRAGYLLGSFDRFAGQYFAGVWDENKVVISPLMVERIIQPWWRCLVAGTMVKASTGDVPIEQVRAGDMVWTRAGLRRVVRSWKSGSDREVVRAKFSSGQVLIGTRDHEICVNKGEFKRLDCVSMGDRISTWNRDSLTEKNTQRVRTDTTDHPLHRSTGIYGSITMGQLLQGSISTIKMAIRRIMTSPTLSAFRCRNISASRVKVASALRIIAQRCWLALRHGGPLKKANHTSPFSGPSGLRLVVIPEMSFAGDAGLLRSRIHGKPHSVPPRATSDGEGAKGLTTLSDHARSADRNTSQTRPTVSVHAQEVADKNSVYLESLQPYGKADVYDLAVEDDHEFYANGILVHNCWIGQDWGFTDHAATVWCATGKLAPSEMLQLFGVSVFMPVDVVVVKREYVVNQRGESDYAQDVCDRTREWEKRVLKDVFLSKDAWNVRGSQNTVSDLIGPVMRRNGLPAPEKADQDRVGGWRLIWNCLKQTCSLMGASPVWTPGIPMLLVSAECVELISAMPLLISDPKDVNDILRMTTITEDISDALRYALKSYLKPKAQAPADVRFAEATRGMVHPNQVAMAARVFGQREGRRTSGRPRWRG